MQNVWERIGGTKYAAMVNLAACLVWAAMGCFIAAWFGTGKLAAWCWVIGWGSWAASVLLFGCVAYHAYEIERLEASLELERASSRPLPEEPPQARRQVEAYEEEFDDFQ